MSSSQAPISSSTTTQTTMMKQQQSAQAPKKKFGKNLNKLVQQTQLTNETTNSNNNGSNNRGNSRNGLLLLSTGNSKKTSGLLSTASATSSSGVFAQQQQQQDVTEESNAVPDAWGVKVAAKTAAPETASASNTDNNSPVETVNEKKQEPVVASPANRGESNDKKEEATKSPEENTSAPSSRWDEYGGRAAAAAAAAGKNNQKPKGTLVSVGEDENEYSRSPPARQVVENEYSRGPPRDTENEYSRGPSKQLENEFSRGPKQVVTKERSGSQGDEKRNNRVEEEKPPTMIHLSSYEDRDRGLSNQPRMLFDPKSGSMVAVKAREENPKPKKAAKKVENVRGKNATNGKSLRDTKAKSRKSQDGSDSSRVQLLKNSDASAATKKKKQNQPQPIPRVRRSLPRTCGVLYARNKNKSSQDSNVYYCVDGCDGDLGYGAHSVPGGRNRNPGAYAKYKEEQQKNIRRAGGKQQHQFGNNKDTRNSNDLWLDAGDMIHDPQHLPGYGGGNEGFESHIAKPSVALFTGFNPIGGGDDHHGNEHSDEEQPDLTLDWVTADDKLELAVGLDDSPTLKPTARIFAPSQAALAAAATLRTQESQDSGSDDDIRHNNNNSNNIIMSVVMHHDEDMEEEDDEEIDEHHHQTVNKAAMDILDDDDDDDDEIAHNSNHGADNIDPFGLGFDPTQDMHGLIQSPDSGAESRLVSGLHGLKLEPPLLSSTFTSPLTDNDATHCHLSNPGHSSGGVTGGSNSNFATTPSNLFAFGSSGPWGNSAGTSHMGTGASTNWDVDILKLAREAGSGASGPGSTGSGGLFGSDSAFGTGLGGSWGATTPTLGGLSLNGAGDGGSRNTDSGD